MRSLQPRCSVSAPGSAIRWNNDASYRTDPYFGFAVPTSVPGIEPHLLYPMKTWKDKAAFDETARKLVGMFQQNFTKFEQHVDAEVRAAAPEVRIAAE